MALPLLQRRYGRRRGCCGGRRGHPSLGTRDIRQLRGRLARAAVGGEDAYFAKALGDARKIVASNQTLEFTWRNSEQLPGDLVEAVAALKVEPGDTHIAMSGSPSIVRQLLAAGMLDESHLLVHPIAVRKGMRLFDDGVPRIPLRLISSETFETGVLNLVFGPAGSPPEKTYEDAKAHLIQSLEDE